jgi:two-component system, NtrC family, response regulator AtoC
MTITPTLLIALEDTQDGERRVRDLHALGIECEAAANLDVALASLSTGPFPAIVVEWDSGRGSALLRAVVARHPDIRVIALAKEDLSMAVEAMRAGAWDVVPNTAEPVALAAAWRRLLEANEEMLALAPQLVSPEAGLVGESRPMQQVRDTVRRAAPGSATVLLRGESGTGKELVARAIHDASRRAKGPFVKIHCAALPDTLLESELFGYEKGAFTGAWTRKPGRVDVAEGGTLFLDEIGDITPAIQVKLLRLLQDKQYERLGSTETRHADIRFIAATHRDLEDMVTRREFREDLFYRLNVVPLWLPPLRIRHGDIVLLANYFCALFGKENDRAGARLSDGALEVLRAQRWPGNVRQLQNFVERLVVLSDTEVVTEKDVKRELVQGIPFPTLSTKAPLASLHESAAAPSGESPPTTGSAFLPLDEEVRLVEQRALVRALKRAQGNRTLAARLLGVGRATLYKKMQEYGVS